MTELAYTPEQTVELRREYLEQRIAPVVRQIFKDHSQLQSIMMLVAQFWNDEADDAVHYRLVLSELPTPDVSAALEQESDPNLPSGGEQFWMGLKYKRQVEWDANHQPIALFAAFCKEGCSQDMGVHEAFSPYAIFRRKGDALQVEVVGVMLRPWLDGVRPQSEAPG